MEAEIHISYAYYASVFTAKQQDGTKRCQKQTREAGGEHQPPGQLYAALAGYHSRRRPVRNDRAPGWSPVDEPFTPPTPVITPTLASAVMSMAGFE